MTVGRGFCTQTAFKKHLDGDWKTVHELWSHIRNYMVSYAAPDASTYTKTEIDAMFEGYSGGKAQVDAGNVVGLTQGSIPFADASGFLTEDNSNLFWDATNKRLAIGHSSPDTDCALHIEFSAQESVNSRLAAKTRPWRQWECLDGNWGLAIGIHADDGKIHLNYDAPIGTRDTSMIVFDGPNARVGILNDAPTYPCDIGGNTRIAGSGATELKVETSGQADPFICLKTTFTDGNGDIAHQINISLDQDANNDNLLIQGQTASVDTQLVLRSQDGERARILLYSGSANYGYLHYGATDDLILANTKSNDDLIFGINDGGVSKTITWDADVDQLKHSHGLFDFHDDNILTTGTLGAGQTTLADSTIADDARGLSAIFTLSANPAKSDGIAFYSEGHIGAITTDGPTYGAGIWLNIDSGATLGADVRALDIGIYEADADCSGGNAYGLAIHMEFDDTNPPAAMYMFRLNTNVAAGHATPDALIFAANKSALAVTEGDFPFDNYLKIVVQDGTVYKIPLVTEGSEGIAVIGTLTLTDGLITDSGGVVSFGTDTISCGGLDVTDYLYFDKDVKHVTTIGYQAGNALDGATWTTLIGEQAGYSLTDGGTIIAIGSKAGYFNETGTYNIYIGYLAGYGAAGQSHDFNTLIGYKTGYAITTGDYNTCISYGAGEDLTEGISNIFIGANAGGDEDVGDYNIFIGHNSGRLQVGNNNNLAIGYQAGYRNDSNALTAIGHYAGYSNTSGIYNLMLGYYAGYLQSTGGYNIYIGAESGRSGTTSTKNLMIGYQAGYATTAGSNTFLGGYGCGRYNVGGDENVYIGGYAGFYNVSGADNVYIGERAGFGATTKSAHENVIIGRYAGYNINDAANQNVILGCMAAEDITTGHGNVVIGYKAAEGQLTTGNDQLWIANSDTAAPLIYGEFPNTLLRINAPLDIGRDGALRGALTLWDGAGGNTPGYMKIHSPDGTAWYVFVEDDGTVKIHNGVPAANADGDAIGDQTD